MFKWYVAVPPRAIINGQDSLQNGSVLEREGYSGSILVVKNRLEAVHLECECYPYYYFIVCFRTRGLSQAGLPRVFLNARADLGSGGWGLT